MPQVPSFEPRRRNPRAGPLELPAEGYQGEVPPWPLPGRTSAASLWPAGPGQERSFFLVSGWPSPPRYPPRLVRKFGVPSRGLSARLNARVRGVA